VIYGSVCSGIEAATAAWEPLGWKAAFFSEIERIPNVILEHHYRGVPNYGDITKFLEWPDATIDVLVGGTPCQSFSIAGLRGGLDDPRGNLLLAYLEVAARYRPKWLVWENVPGVLSSNGGRDFGTLLGGMAELGYGTSYRVLDAQYFGVPQRRRRVFVVGCLGDWRRAAAVLFERSSLRGDPAPRRKARQGVAGPLGGSAQSGGFRTTDLDNNGAYIVSHDPACTLTARDYKGPLPEADLSTVVAHSLRCEGFDAGEDGTGRGTPIIPAVTHTLSTQSWSAKEDGTGRGCPLVPVHTVGALACNTGPNGHDAGNFACNQAVDSGHLVPIAFNWQNGGGYGEANEGLGITVEGTGQLQRCQTPAVAFSIMPMNSNTDYKARETDVAQPLMAAGPQGGNQGGDYLVQRMCVRRLTPRECERLQGLPDDYTRVPTSPGKVVADGARYKAIGNSMAVPVMRWIGERIAAVDAIP